MGSTANFHTPYALRVQYAETGAAKHRVTIRRTPVRALVSIAREVGDILWGAFIAPA